MRQKVILTLTQGEPHGLRGCTPFPTLQASAFVGCELIAHAGDGTLLFAGRVDFSRSNSYASKPSWDLTIDARRLTSCASSQIVDPQAESDGTSCIRQS